MRRSIAFVFLTALLSLSFAQSAWGLYRLLQLEKFPIDRVLANLADRAAEKPKDAKLKFNLARAYAMAYASKADQVEMKGDDVWYGYEPRNVPFTNKPAKDPAVQTEAEKKLAQAIETYEEALKLAPADTVGRLGYAWSLDQAGQKDAAIAEYRKVIEEAWKKEADLKRAGLGFHSITAEAAGYLVPKLDKTKDAVEITDLKARIAKMEALPRPITPIAIPLADGLSAAGIEDRPASVAFDADGSALNNRRWSWIKPNAGWLVIDKTNSGKVDSGLQLFGNVTFWIFWQHGYEPLSALDDNRDGQLRGRELAGLAIWHDSNCNGTSDPGEVRPLADHGIVALCCRHQIDSSQAESIEYSPAGVTFADGRTRPSYDLRLHRK